MTTMLHCVILSRKAEQDHIAEGLGPLKLNKIREHPNICKPLLVQSNNNGKVTVEKLKSCTADVRGSDRTFEEVSY